MLPSLLISRHLRRSSGWSRCASTGAAGAGRGRREESRAPKYSRGRPARPRSRPAGRTCPRPSGAASRAPTSPSPPRPGRWVPTTTGETGGRRQPQDQGRPWPRGGAAGGRSDRRVADERRPRLGPVPVTAVSVSRVDPRLLERRATARPRCRGHRARRPVRSTGHRSRRLSTSVTTAGRPARRAPGGCRRSPARGRAW